MNAWNRRRKSIAGRVFPEAEDELRQLLESGAYDDDNEFQPPGESIWLSAAEALRRINMPPAPAVRPTPDASPSEPIPPLPIKGAPLQAATTPAPFASPSQETARPKTGAPAAAARFADAPSSSLASGSRRGRLGRVEEDDEMEMTPMIDMVFLLLIFFMVAGTISQHGPIDLPMSTTGDAEDPRERVVLMLDFPERVSAGGASGPEADIPGARPILLADARLRLTGGEEIIAGDLESRLRQEFADKPNGQLVLQAHRKMPSSVVRQVLKVAQQAGARETLVGVAVSP